MIPALLWTAAGIIFAVEVTVIAFRVWSDGDAIKADEVPLTLPYAEAREDLTEPPPVDVLAIHIGRRDDNPAPERAYVERLARELEPEGSPWRVPVGSAVAISQAARAASATWGAYVPRHAKDGEITQVFKAITANLRSSDETTELVSAA